MRRHSSAGSATPSAAQTPSFHGCPRGTTGQARMPSRAGLTACQMSTYGCPVTSTSGEVTEATMRLSLVPATRWSTSTPSRRPGPGPKAPTAEGSSSIPSSGSTTTPSTRRSSPQIRSTRAASWMPSTQIRLARATRAGCAGTATEPLAVSRRAGVATAARGRRNVTGAPSSRNPAGASGKLRRLPNRSSSTTAPDSKPMTAPQNPDSASSTTSSGSASTSGTTLRRRRSPLSTSSPYTPSDASRPGRRGGRAAPDDTGHVTRHRAATARTLACMSPAARAATLTVRRSTRFVTWVRSWRAGLVPYDEVPDEIAEGEEHLVADVPETWTEVPLREVLRLFAKLHPDEIRGVLPVPGDPRGLPGPGEFTGAALLAQEAVVAGGYGLVPEVRQHTSGSGDVFETVLWRGFEPAPPPPAARPPAPPAAGGAQPAAPHRH